MSAPQFLSQSANLGSPCRVYGLLAYDMPFYEQQCNHVLESSMFLGSLTWSVQSNTSAISSEGSDIPGNQDIGMPEC